MTLRLDGLTPAPAQVRGAFRLVPLLRDRPCDDVRLSLRPYDHDLTVVDVGDRTRYVAFVPHALVVEQGGAFARVTLGGQVSRAARRRDDWLSIGHLERMRRREGRGLRFLPLHLAMEGLLALHFAPPNVAWRELSTRFLRSGLGERHEYVVPGRALPGFEDALRTFELHDRQVGMLVFTADQLAAVFVVPSPQDYRRLHATLLMDFYGELVMRYALLYPDTAPVQATPHFEAARSLVDVREGLTRTRASWAAYTRDVMCADLLDRDLKVQPSYELGDLRLERFVTNLDPSLVNHIGERLVRPDGELLYLKTFQLSAAQTRRAFLLSQLAAHGWHLGDAAVALRTTVNDLVLRLEKAGFGYLVTTALREQAASERHRSER